jgi:hypothetical protein
LLAPRVWVKLRRRGADRRARVERPASSHRDEVEVMAESDEVLAKEVERLRAENAALKARSGRELRLQVSAKGGVSLYGIRRFPVTFYLEEWQRILDMADDIRAFLREHEGELKKKQG